MANLVLVHKQEINTGRVFPTRSSRIASFSDKSQFGIFFPESVFQILSFVCRPLCRCHPSAICALGKGADDPEIPTNTICSILNLEKTAVATTARAGSASHNSRNTSSAIPTFSLSFLFAFVPCLLCSSNSFILSFSSVFFVGFCYTQSMLSRVHLLKQLYSPFNIFPTFVGRSYLRVNFRDFILFSHSLFSPFVLPFACVSFVITSRDSLSFALPVSLFNRQLPFSHCVKACVRRPRKF